MCLCVLCREREKERECVCVGAFVRLCVRVCACVRVYVARFYDFSLKEFVQVHVDGLMFWSFLRD